MTDTWEPEFPGQRPPFAQGNLLPVTHGAWSRALVVPLAEQVLDSLLPTLPAYLQEPRYRPAVQAYAVCLARLERVSAWLEAQGDEGSPPEVDSAGDVRGAMGLLLRLEREADRHRSSLGLTPLAAARLGKDVAKAVSLTTLWAQDDDEDRAHG